MEQRSWVSSTLILLVSVGLLAAESGDKGFTLSLQDAVKYAIDNNREVMQARLELVKADTNLMKFESKYSWRALSKAELDEKKIPFQPKQYFYGNKNPNQHLQCRTRKTFYNGNLLQTRSKVTTF